MNLSEAIRELRQTSGKSQQVLATELGVVIKTLQMYEQGRMPEPKNLLALAAYADRLDRADLYKIFVGDALLNQLKPPVGYKIEVKFWRSPITARRAATVKTAKRIKK